MELQHISALQAENHLNPSVLEKPRDCLCKFHVFKAALGVVGSTCCWSQQAAPEHELCFLLSTHTGLGYSLGSASWREQIYQAGLAVKITVLVMVPRAELLSVHWGSDMQCKIPTEIYRINTTCFSSHKPAPQKH